MRELVLGIILFISISLKAQFIISEDIVIFADGTPMQIPFCGGMNTPQFSQIDINQDSNSDLYIYDGSAYKHIVLINTGVPSEYKYAPEFEKNFPAAEDWALLRDFNCDNIPDFFAYSSGGTIVYVGKVEDGTIHFELYEQRLSYTTTIEVPIYTARTDISSFVDVDGDDDLDVLAFAVSGTLIRFYKNKSVEMGYGCDSLIFEIADYCWGLISEGAICSGAELGVACKGGDAPEEMDERVHVGSTMLAYDQDNDDDLDIILGDVSCDNLVYYENGGTSEYAEMIWSDSIFPFYDVPLKIIEFPAAYGVDIDQDGNMDLLAAPNEFSLGLNIENVWYYKNVTDADTIKFELQSSTFFLNEMIDAGTISKPVFFDFNADGLQDILIGVRNTFGADNEKKYGLWLYQNTGTEALPSFELFSQNYASLAEYMISDLAPFPADMNSDGDVDLLIGMFDGTFIFLENIAGSGSVAIFDSPVFNYQSIDVGGFAVPCLFDVNEDGLLDLIAGKSAGTLSYFENTGTITISEFTLQSENWGGVDVRKPGSFEGFSAPFMYRNVENEMELVVGSFYGYIYLYDEIEESLLGEFHERDTFFLKYNPGFHSTIFGSNIKGDTHLEFLVGNLRGGIQIFEFDNSSDVTVNQESNVLNLYPNPAHDYVSIYGIKHPNAMIEIYNVTGQQMYRKLITDISASLEIHSLPAGIYFIKITNENRMQTSTLIKK